MSHPTDDDARDDLRDDLDAALAALPTADVSAATAERIRREAHAALARAARPRALASRVRRTYRRAEPVLVLAVAASYLFFAFQAAILPYAR
jgi:hypothetical protein